MARRGDFGRAWRSGSFHAAGADLLRWADRAPEPHRAAVLWALVVGAEIRERSRVTGLHQRRLRVEVEEEEWRSALEDMQGDLLSALNRCAARDRYTGFDFVTANRG